MNWLVWVGFLLYMSFVVLFNMFIVFFFVEIEKSGKIIDEMMDMLCEDFFNMLCILEMDIDKFIFIIVVF